jgi:AraC family transcriptional regulator, regulatory protein of adaptative response / methylated-DNA-[protein]-cysteine methyltransferase
MWHAFIHKAQRGDGAFFVGVLSTGIFCRPVCTARPPLRKNVRFFATAKEALLHGLRPCKRCRPLAAGSAPPALVATLMQHIEAEPGMGPVRERTLIAMGIDPSTARRQFQKWTGMSFAGYQRLRRMGRALTALSRPAPRVRARQSQEKTMTVMHAQETAGFASASGFREAMHRLLGEPPREVFGAGVEGVVLLPGAWIDTPLGPMLCVVRDAESSTHAGLVVLDFVDRKGLERHLDRLRVRLGTRSGSTKKRPAVIVPTPIAAHALLTRVATQLEEYFAGERTKFDLPLADGLGTPFQERVWQALREIPLGQTRSYLAQSKAIGTPGAVRAVALANGANYRSIVIPCHRVIGSDGSLTGYGGGLDRKRWLLEHEGAITSS